MFINYFGLLPWFLLISKNLCMNSWGFLRTLPLLLMTGVVSPLLLLLTNHSISENTFLIFFCPPIFLTFVPQTWVTPLSVTRALLPGANRPSSSLPLQQVWFHQNPDKKLQNHHTPLHILLGSGIPRALTQPACLFLVHAHGRAHCRGSWANHGANSVRSHSLKFH